MTALRRYPVKSCRGHDVDRARVERAGLDGDRRWMLAHPDGSMATARTLHGLVLVVPVPGPDGLSLSAPGMEPIHVPLPHPSGGLMDVRVHAWDTAGVRAGVEADEWFSQVAGTPLRLLYLEDPGRRRPNPEYSEPDDRVSFADGFPLLLTTEESLAALNAHIADGRNAHEGPMPMTRFRPNVVVSGFPAWAEDGWQRIRIGDAGFRVARGCARCVLTTVDPDTSATGREPLATLARHRRWDQKVWFGQNLIPDDPGVTIGVDDPVEVVDA
ncbi:MOSC domain-containing protein [Pseudonocardia endophytica]|uniref:MOSC domain-containing protein n=1 Tax=Pseudonocardia endophytica TaxID=401976 RepID=UPI001FB31707|nr:MOSC N-terminal beta barrel domain-containing protein [Pseudonocardia endophytica]